MNHLKYFVSILAMLSVASAQAPSGFLTIQVIGGEGAFNSIKGKVGNSPVVVIKDEQDRPVAGATVRFALPTAGAGATFAGGESTAEVKTDENGRATAPSMKLNDTEGRFNIKVTASQGNREGSAVIAQTNTLAGVAESKHSKKALIFLILAAGAGGGAAAALHGGKSAPVVAPPTPITLSVGGISVGPPAH